ncbi:MAG TPA: ornithine carbamoyltransferase [Nitrososphaeraceae archaeon]
MRISLNSKNILSLRDLTAVEINYILRLASSFKNDLHTKKSRRLVPGSILGMLFEKASTRTRVSFETGIFQLGGKPIYLGINEIQLSRGESIEDTARTLSLYVDCIVARIYDHDNLERLAFFATVPVINGLSNSFHPCQILADLLTIYERKKKLRGLKLAWIGDGNNVCNDMLLGCSKVGINMTVACPKGYEPMRYVIDLAMQEGTSTNAEINITDDPKSAAKFADIIVTDTFISMGKDNEKQSRDAAFLPKYQVNSNLMTLAKKDCIFMHCLPATRGKEVTSEVIDGDASVVWNEAENRLHVQKALMYSLLKN